MTEFFIEIQWPIFLFIIIVCEVHITMGRYLFEKMYPTFSASKREREREREREYVYLRERKEEIYKEREREREYVYLRERKEEIYKERERVFLISEDS